MSKHPSGAHHSDHSGAHHRGTAYHQKHANTLANAHSSDSAEDHEQQMPPMPSAMPADPGTDANGEDGGGAPGGMG